jgi:hypothetical protein
MRPPSSAASSVAAPVARSIMGEYDALAAELDAAIDAAFLSDVAHVAAPHAPPQQHPHPAALLFSATAPPVWGATGGGVGAGGGGGGGGGGNTHYQYAPATPAPPQPQLTTAVDSSPFWAAVAAQAPSGGHGAAAMPVAPPAPPPPSYAAPQPAPAPPAPAPMPMPASDFVGMTQRVRQLTSMLGMPSLHQTVPAPAAPPPAASSDAQPPAASPRVHDELRKEAAAAAAAEAEVEVLLAQLRALDRDEAARRRTGTAAGAEGTDTR